MTGSFFRTVLLILEALFLALWMFLSAIGSPLADLFLFLFLGFLALFALLELLRIGRNRRNR